MDAARRRRREVKHRHADIAAELHVAPGLPQHVGDQRRRRRFAVGAGDGDQRRVGRARRALAGEQFDVADHLDAGRLRPLDRPVRLRVGQRHAGRQQQGVEARPIGLAQIDQGKLGRLGARGLAVVPRSDLRAAGDQRARGREPGAAEAEQRDAAPGEGRDRRHAHLSFKVASPTIASTKATIQNRMTICGSDQPSCSK